MAEENEIEERRQRAVRAEAIMKILSPDNPFIKLALSEHIATCKDCNGHFIAILNHWKESKDK